MSEERVKLNNSYDPSKDLTITLSASYITGIENVFLHYVTQMENPAMIKPIVEKFERYIENPEKVMKDEPFDESELRFYTLYSLIEMLKAAAYEQGANVEINATVSRSDIDDLLKASVDGDYEKMKEINQKIQTDLESQLP